MEQDMNEVRVRNFLRKCDRLCHRKSVDMLFDKGHSVYAYPLRMFYLSLTGEQVRELCGGHDVPAGYGRVQMMVTVPKKKFKRAVDRVLLRRRIREAYRLNCHELRGDVAADAQGRYLLLAFIYVGGEMREFASVERKMQKLLSGVHEALYGADVADDSEGEECDA